MTVASLDFSLFFFFFFFFEERIYILQNCTFGFLKSDIIGWRPFLGVGHHHKNMPI